MGLILRLNETMRMHFPWRQIIAGIILAVFCSGLYINVKNENAEYHNYEVYEIESLETGKAVNAIGRIGDAAMIDTWKTLYETSAGTIVGENTGTKKKAETKSIKKGEKTESIEQTEDVAGKERVPAITEITVTTYNNDGTSETANYTFKITEFSLDNLVTPKRAGKIFNGWYLDPECTNAFDGNIEGVKALTLYAGWKDIPGFITNEKGYITGYSDASIVVADGVAVLPSVEGCTGIVRGALDGLADEIFEIYIPANITYIESGTFDSLYNLMYIEVASGNPVYYSKGGVLHHRSGELEASPCGW